MIAIRPANTYLISLPDDVLQRSDERVSSFWRPGSNTALQLSSYVRDSGQQINAKQRLIDRMARGAYTWVPVDGFRTDWCPDAAAAILTSTAGWVWTHIYLVWPDLAVYATVSRPPDEDRKSDAWALDSVKSVRRTSEC